MIMLLFSLTSLARVFKYDDDILLFTFLSIPLVIKISLMTLKTIQTRILTNLPTNPYYAVHLPALIDQNCMKAVLFTVDRQVNKATLYSMAFMSGHVGDFAGMDQETASEEIRKCAFNIVSKKMSDLLRSHMKNELLLITLAQIYLAELRDNFRALSIVNALKNKKLSTNGTLSLQVLSKVLYNKEHEELQEESQSQSIHFEYFSYKKKSLAFKMLIKAEIAENLKIWKMVQAGTVHTKNLIEFAEKAHESAKEVARYWARHFQFNQYKYINPCLMYGIYMEVLQALPFGGVQLMQKAYTALGNKWHLNKDLIDIIKKKNAIIVASIMPESLGKVIETSASAKELFQTPSQGLVGSNVAVIMPSFIGSRHNNFIKKYQRDQRYHQPKSNFISYAKTFNDDFFKVELMLNLFADSVRGLNVAVCVKKVGDFETLIVVDEYGAIVECSKSIAKTLNLSALTSKKDQISLRTVCPDLNKVDQAFSMIYKPVKLLNKETIVEESQMFTEGGNGKVGLPQKETTNLFSSETLATRANQKLLKTIHEKETLFTENDEKQQAKYHPSDVMKKEDAEKLCEKYREGHQVYFNPYGGNNQSSVQMRVEIEPMVIDGLLYKILRVQQSNQQSLTKLLEKFQDEAGSTNSHSGPTLMKHSLKISKEEKTELEISTFAENFPTARERERETDFSQIADKSTTLGMALGVETKKSVKEPAKNAKSQILSEKAKTSTNHIATSKTKKLGGNKENSIIASSMSKRTTTKRFKDALRTSTQNPTVRLSIWMVYLAIVIIIASICLGYIYSVGSLTDMNDSMDLISLVNLRLSKTIITWQSVLVVYMRSVGLRAIDARVQQYQSVVVSKSLEMISNSNEVLDTINNLENRDISETFFEKSIAFYDPTDKTLFNGGQIDAMAANNILTDYDLYVGRYTGSVLELNKDPKVLFSMNNTANDYFDNLDNTISYVDNFFESTKAKNMNLMKIITTLEMLFAFSPLILIALLMYWTVQKHSKLSQVFTKIQDTSIQWRVQQLESLTAHFEQNLEDTIVDYNESKYYKSTNTIKSSFVGIKDSKKPGISTRIIRRNYRLRSLTLFVLRYLLLAGAMTALTINFLSLSLVTSIENLTNLDQIKSQVVTTYQVSSDIKMILPAFYFTLSTINDTDFTLKYLPPVVEVTRAMQGLGNATKNLLEALSYDGGFDDATIYDILDGDVCAYVTDTYKQNCSAYTNGNSFGLLGLFGRYETVCSYMTQYFASSGWTWETTKDFLVPFGIALENVHFVIYDACDSLSLYIVKYFNSTVESEKEKILTLFVASLAVVVISMMVLRGVVLRKLHRLNLAVKKIVDIIPFRMAYENKVITYYLGREMKKELGNMNVFN